MTRGLIFNIQGFSIHDGPGIRTSVFLKGCPLDCPWCANPESKSPNQQITHIATHCAHCGNCAAICPRGCIKIDEDTFYRDESKCNHCLACINSCPTHALTVEGEWYTVAEVIKAVEKDRAFYEKSGGGITLSGGEPLFQEEFTFELLKELKKHNFHVNIETTGYTSAEYLAKIIPYLDLVYMDMKHPDDKIHKQKTGVSKQIIIENMKTILKSGVPLVARIPVIPRFNNSQGVTKAFGKLLSETGVADVHLLPFHQFGANKWLSMGLDYEYEQDKSMPVSEVIGMADTLREYGLNVQIGGS